MAGLGPTHYRWGPRAYNLNRRVEAAFPPAQGNTYEDHPWDGWDHLSIDWWGRRGRGDSLRADLAGDIARYIYNNRWNLRVRHYILGHTLWHHEAGFVYWQADDHSGRLRHVHVTLLP